MPQPLKQDVCDGAGVGLRRGEQERGLEGPHLGHAPAARQVYLSVYLSIYLSIYVYLSIYLSICIYIHTSIFLPTYLLTFSLTYVRMYLPT